MPVGGSASKNPDQTTDYAINAVSGDSDLALTANLFANNYRDKPDGFNPSAPQYSTAGGGVGIVHGAGHSANITAQDISGFGKQLKAETNVNILQTENHRVDVSAFVAQNIPKANIPAFQSQGSTANYYFKDTVNASASVTRTPDFNQTNYSVTTGANFNPTPTSSVSLGVGATRQVTKMDSGKWEPRLFLGIKKTF